MIHGRIAFAFGLLYLCSTIGASSASADSGARVEMRRYSPLPGLKLKYAIAIPKAPAPGGIYPVWIYQAGDGFGNFPYVPIYAKRMVKKLAAKYGVIAVLPQIRREHYALHLKKFCNLDFRHRIVDLNAVTDEVLKRPDVDLDRVFFVGFSGGSEVVTMTSETREDLAGVITVSGSLVQWGDYLRMEEPHALELRVQHNRCRWDSYLLRGERFWQELLYSNLTERIRCSRYPYFAMVGSKDGGGKVAKLDSTVLSCLLANKSDLKYEVIRGMGHIIGFHHEVWDKIAAWTREHSRWDALMRAIPPDCGDPDIQLSTCGPFDMQ